MHSQSTRNKEGKVRPHPGATVRLRVFRLSILQNTVRDTKFASWMLGRCWFSCLYTNNFISQNLVITLKTIFLVFPNVYLFFWRCKIVIPPEWNVCFWDTRNKISGKDLSDKVSFCMDQKEQVGTQSPAARCVCVCVCVPERWVRSTVAWYQRQRHSGSDKLC